MITVNENGLASAREVHQVLVIKERFSVWFQNALDFFENEYEVISCKFIHSQNKQEMNDFSISINFAKAICLRTRKDAGLEIYKELSKLQEKEIFIKFPKRKEIQFKEILEKAFGSEYIETQVFVCGKYYIDFVLFGSIAIEYDEKRHNFQIEDDKKRQCEIQEFFREYHYCPNCEVPFVRVKEGFELEALKEIIEICVLMDLIYTTDGKTIRKTRSKFLE